MRYEKPNKAESLLADWVGENRQGVANRKQLNNRKYSNKDDSEIHKLGALGELMFAKLFRLYPDSFFDDYYGKLKGWDITIESLIGIDVKTTTSDPGALIVPRYRKNNPAPFYALMLNRGDRFYYAGAIKGADVFTDERLDGYIYRVPIQALKAGRIWDYKGN